VHLTTEGTFGYVLCGDNIDFTVKAHWMRLVGSRNQSYHFIHCYAVKDRIDFSHLTICPPPKCLKTPLQMSTEILPSHQTDSELVDDICMLVSRVIVSYLSFFKHTFSDVVYWHFKNKYFEEMSKKSEVVSVLVVSL
jgi:hypothetical protein